MIVATVIGNVWATRKDDRLDGLKLLIVCPRDYADPDAPQKTLIAADIIGAGVGEDVLVVTGSSARSATHNPQIPIDATIVGIVDDYELSQSSPGR